MLIRRLMLLLLLVVIVAGSGYAWLRHRQPEDSNTLTLYGNVDIREAQPAFNATGRITAMLVQEGARIKRGQLLATLDDTRYAAALDAVQAQMQDRKHALDKLLAGSRPEEIAQTKATMDSLQTVYRNDEANYKRDVRLAISGTVSVKRRDDAKAAFETAKHQYAAAEQAYLLAVKGPRQEDIDSARAATNAAAAAVALAQREYDDTKLYAPADGVVEDRILEPGDMATPAVPVFTIALPSPLWVRAFVPETDLGRIHAGMSASVTTDSYPGRQYHGWIGYISPTAEFTPKTVETPALRTALVYQIRVYVCDDNNEFRLGMPATVAIDLKEKTADTQPACGPHDSGS